MQITKYLVFSIFIILISCKPGDKIVVGDIENLRFGGIKNNEILAYAELQVKNDNSSKILIKGFELEASVNGSYLGSVISRDTIVIPKHSDATYPLTFHIKIKNIMLGARIMNQVINNKTISGEIYGEIKVYYMLIPKRIQVRERF